MDDETFFGLFSSPMLKGSREALVRSSARIHDLMAAHPGDHPRLELGVQNPGRSNERVLATIIQEKNGTHLSLVFRGTGHETETFFQFVLRALHAVFPKTWPNEVPSDPQQAEATLFAPVTASR